MFGLQVGKPTNVPSMLFLAFHCMAPCGRVLNCIPSPSSPRNMSTSSLKAESGSN